MRQVFNPLSPQHPMPPPPERVYAKYNLTQLRAAWAAYRSAANHLRKAGITGPVLLDAENKAALLSRMCREQWEDRKREASLTRKRTKANPATR